MIKLHDGTGVRVEGVIMSRPYGGMMEGIPTKDMSERILERAKTSFESLWGSREVHVIDPPRRAPKLMGYSCPDEWPERYKTFYPNPEKLPENMFQVWLTSFATFDADDDGTAVVLVFFSDKEQATETSLSDLIVEASKSFIWKDVSKGFGF